MKDQYRLSVSSGLGLYQLLKEISASLVAKCSVYVPAGCSLSLQFGAEQAVNTAFCKKKQWPAFGNGATRVLKENQNSEVEGWTAKQ